MQVRTLKKNEKAPMGAFFSKFQKIYPDKNQFLKE